VGQHGAPRHVLAAQIAIVGALLPTCFTVLASLILFGLTGLLRKVPHPLWDWWHFLFLEGANPNTRVWLAISGVPAGIISLVVTGLLLYELKRFRAWSLRRNPAPTRAVPAPIRAATDNFGHARFMTLPEAKGIWPGPDPTYGGVVIGEAYDPLSDEVATIPFDPSDKKTWGRGGSSPLLIDPCRGTSTHSLLFSGSGGYKTTGSAVPTLLHWEGSAIVLDPSLELSPMLAEARRQMGHEVFTLHPAAADEVGFNAIEWIDIESPMAEIHVASVVEWVCGSTPSDNATAAFFAGRGKALVQCLLAHMLWDPEVPAERKTLRRLRAGLVAPEPELREILSEIHRSSPSRMARHLAGGLKDTIDETFSGIYANAAEYTSWLSNPAFAGMVSGASFRCADIAVGRVTVFVALPLEALQSTPAVARTVVGALVNAVFQREGAVESRVLFLLDEVARLGRLPILEIARDAGRKYGLTMHLLYQSVGQMVDQWGEGGRRAWFDAVAWRGYAAIKDDETARELSASIGQYGVLTWSESENSGRNAKMLEGGSRSTGSGLSFQETARALMSPDEIMNDLREDALVVVPKKGRPLVCGRAIYFRRDDMRGRVAENRFAPGTDVTHG
jgi:type IV secretion system protein VirD4